MFFLQLIFTSMGLGLIENLSDLGVIRYSISNSTKAHSHSPFSLCSHGERGKRGGGGVGMQRNPRMCFHVRKLHLRLWQLRRNPSSKLKTQGKKAPYILSFTTAMCLPGTKSVSNSVLLLVALWFILRGDLLYVFPCVILFLCFSVLLVLQLPRLGKRELNDKPSLSLRPELPSWN